MQTTLTSIINTNLLGLDSCLKFYAFAARQFAAGDISWVQYVMKLVPKKLKETIGTAMAMSTATETLRRQALSHMGFLREALAETCICDGKAAPGWRGNLQLNDFDEAQYLASLRALFEACTGVDNVWKGEKELTATAAATIERPAMF